MLCLKVKQKHPWSFNWIGEEQEVCPLPGNNGLSLQTTEIKLSSVVPLLLELLSAAKQRVKVFCKGEQEEVEEKRWLHAPLGCSDKNML